MQCNICGNNLKTRKVLANYTGPFCSKVYARETYCEYCEWKGTTGPGKQLREAIAEKNN